MNISSLAAVTNRVGEIQARINRTGADRGTFAETLQVAEAAASRKPGATTFVVAPQGLPDTKARANAGALPIGITGAPVLLRPGVTVSTYGNGLSGSWPAALPAAGKSWAPAIERAAADAGIDPRLLAAMVWQESGFQADAVSRSGALGLAQLMPATAAGLGVDPTDPFENLDGGARYLSWTIKEFGSIELGLAAYNAGPGTVRSAGGIPDIPETQAYVPRVMDFYRRLGGVT